MAPMIGPRNQEDHGGIAGNPPPILETLFLPLIEAKNASILAHYSPYDIGQEMDSTISLAAIRVQKDGPANAQ